MKNENITEWLILSKSSTRNFSREESVKWLATTLQHVIRKQHTATKKLFLKTLKDTPAIYLS